MMRTQAGAQSTPNKSKNLAPVQRPGSDHGGQNHNACVEASDSLVTRIAMAVTSEPFGQTIDMHSLPSLDTHLAPVVNGGQWSQCGPACDPHPGLETKVPTPRHVFVVKLQVGRGHHAWPCCSILLWRQQAELMMGSRDLLESVPGLTKARQTAPSSYAPC